MSVIVFFDCLMMVEPFYLSFYCNTVPQGGGNELIPQREHDQTQQRDARGDIRQERCKVYNGRIDEIKTSEKNKRDDNSLDGVLEGKVFSV